MKITKKYDTLFNFSINNSFLRPTGKHKKTILKKKLEYNIKKAKRKG
jgi:hypothetical protein